MTLIIIVAGTRNFLQKSSSKSLPIVASCHKRHYSNVKDFQKSVYYVLYEVLVRCAGIGCAIATPKFLEIIDRIIAFSTPNIS